MGHEGRESREHRRADRRQGQKDEDAQPSEIPHEDLRPSNVGNVPYAVHGALCREPKAHGAIQQEEAAGGDRPRASGQAVNLRVQLRTDDREATQRAVDEVLAQLLVAVHHVAKDGREQHQEWKEREEAVVRDERRLAARLIVAEFLHNGVGEADNAMVLLEVVDPSQGHRNAAGSG